MNVSVGADEIFPPVVCPLDRTELSSQSGALICQNGHHFDVQMGIPRLVASETAYTDAFGEQWATYRATQLDSYTGTRISADRLVRCLGEELWQRLNQPERIDVLETGCGAGRFTEVLLKAPAVRLTSSDLSSAVEPNQINCPQDDRHRVVQADILKLPFRDESYDVVICLGVIQHTPAPETTIAQLYAQVKPGGWLVIDHYTPSLSYYTKVSSLLLRPVLKRLPAGQGSAATEFLTKLFYPMHRAVRNHRALQTILSRVSPLYTYFQMYPQLEERLQYEWALLDTHDSLTDYFKHFRTGPQIHRALDALGARDIWIGKGGNGIEARCRKPSIG